MATSFTAFPIQCHRREKIAPNRLRITFYECWSVCRRIECGCKNLTLVLPKSNFFIIIIITIKIITLEILNLLSYYYLSKSYRGRCYLSRGFDRKSWSRRRKVAIIRKYFASFACWNATRGAYTITTLTADGMNAKDILRTGLPVLLPWTCTSSLYVFLAWFETTKWKER